MPLQRKAKEAVRMQAVRRAVTVAGLMLLVLGMTCVVSLGHDHYGNSDEWLRPTLVPVGGRATVSFGYTIWHDHGGDPRGGYPNPWEIRLDGTPGVRDGILLASGAELHPAYGETLTFHVTQTVTIPRHIGVGRHTIKIITSCDEDWWAYYDYHQKYSYLPFTVGCLVAPCGAAGYLDRGWEEAAGGGGGLDEPPMVGELPLCTQYEVGEIITGCVRVTDGLGNPVEDAYFPLSFYAVTVGDAYDTRVALEAELLRCTGDLGSYCFDIETDGLDPGCYDIRLGLPDGTVQWLRVELVAP